MRTRFVLGLILVAAPARLSAHDFWLAAENWTLDVRTPVTITAGVGEHFPTRTEFRSRENWLAEWRVLGAGGDVVVKKDFRREGPVVATSVTLQSPGAYLGFAEISAQTIEMNGQEFTDYLKEGGLDSIIGARRATGETQKQTKERYARYAKIALRAGDGGAAHLTKPIGVKAEFVPMSDPTTLRPGDAISVQLLVEGKPVVNAAVSAVTSGKAGPTRVATDANGRATLRIGSEGAWLIKTVHMVRLPQPADAEWESYWVTLAFHTSR